MGGCEVRPSLLPALFRLLCLFPLALAIPIGARAESADAATASPLRLHGRHAISIQAGVLSRTVVETGAGAGDVTTEVRANGAIGTLSYAYWVAPEWTIGISLGLLDAKVGTAVSPGEVSSEAAAVTAVLVGAAYHPAGLAPAPTLRPYVSAAVGPYVGSATNSLVGASVTTESVSEAAAGLRVLAGAELFLGRRFEAGIALGYHLVGDFERPIGDDTNYSGPEFSAGVGVLLGAGR